MCGELEMTLKGAVLRKSVTRAIISTNLICSDCSLGPRSTEFTEDGDGTARAGAQKGSWMLSGGLLLCPV